jgi:acyl carrier protein
MTDIEERNVAEGPGNTLETVRALIAAELSIDPASIGADAVLKELPGADSVRLLRVVAKLERQYDTEFEDDDIFEVVTPNDLARLAEAGAGATT